jgi:hypothetical protein
MSRFLLLLVSLCLLVATVVVSGESSQTLQVPHDVNEHELTDHYGEGRDPRFDNGETEPNAARHEEGKPKHAPSSPTGYYPPPPSVPMTELHVRELAWIHAC